MHLFSCHFSSPDSPDMHLQPCSMSCLRTSKTFVLSLALVKGDCVGARPFAKRCFHGGRTAASVDLAGGAGCCMRCCRHQTAHRQLTFHKDSQCMSEWVLGCMLWALCRRLGACLARGACAPLAPVYCTQLHQHVATSLTTSRQRRRQRTQAGAGVIQVSESLVTHERKVQHSSH